MTRNLRALLGAAAIFYLIAVVNDAAAMYVLSAAAVAVMFVCFFLTRLTIRGVSFDLSLPTVRGRPGAQMTGALTVRNAGAIRRAGLSFDALLRNQTIPQAAQPVSFPFPTLDPHSQTEWQVHWQPRHRGQYTVFGARLVASDPLGLYRRGTQPKNAGGFWVLPQTVDLREAMPAEMLMALVPSAVGLSQRGGAEFLGVRPHMPGDDLRQVHWKLTAHTGELLVREYRLQPELAVTIWLDLTEDSYPEPTDLAEGLRCELAISAAASLVLAVAGHGLAFSLAGPGLPQELALTSRGEAAAQRCLMALAEAQVSRSGSFAEWCAATTPVSTHIAALLVVSPTLQRTAGHLAPLLERGVRVIGLCPEGDCTDAEHGPTVRPRRLGRRRAAGHAPPPGPEAQEPSITVGCAPFDRLEALPLAVAQALEEHATRSMR
jgi:uncharacterized protein (DUF58 family)